MNQFHCLKNSPFLYWRWIKRTAMVNLSAIIRLRGRKLRSRLWKIGCEVPNFLWTAHVYNFDSEWTKDQRISSCYSAETQWMKSVRYWGSETFSSTLLWSTEIYSKNPIGLQKMCTQRSWGKRWKVLIIFPGDVWCFSKARQLEQSHYGHSYRHICGG